jgi:hypothetical protein
VVDYLSSRSPKTEAFDEQYIDKDDKDAALYHNKRDKFGRFTKAK